MEASLTRNSHGGSFDDTATVSRIAKLRAERAVLLGYANHAAYQLDDQTIGGVDAVNKLLSSAAGPAVANARKEGADIQAIIDQEKGGFQLASWDWDLYSREGAAGPLRLRRVAAQAVLRVEPRPCSTACSTRRRSFTGLPLRNSTICPYTSRTCASSRCSTPTARRLALFLADYYARPSKRGGAWMNEYVRQSDLFGDKPVVANHLNIPKPPPGQPTLLTSDEVVTAFHEFGHGLHGMFSRVKLPALQRYERAARLRGISFAVQRDVGGVSGGGQAFRASLPDRRAIPTELLDKMLAARKFNQGYKTTEYLAASLLDQAWHQLKPEEVSTDVLGFEAAALKKAGVDYAPVPPRYRSPYFSHSFVEDTRPGIILISGVR